MIDFPNSPATGQVVTAPNGTAWRWSGTTWLLGTAASAAGARGVVAYAQSVVGQTGIGTSGTDIGGLSVTFTPQAGRTYRTTVSLPIYTGTATNYVISLYISNSAGTAIQQRNWGLFPSGQVSADMDVVESNLTPGVPVTRKVRGLIQNGTFQTICDPTTVGYIMVEDITYDGGPGGAVVGKVAAAVVAAFEATSSASYVDLATVGPVVTIETGTTALVTLSCGCNIGTAGNTGVMGVAVSGASTIAASANSGLACFDAEINNTSDYSRQIIVTGLTPGANTFTAKYAVNSSSATFSKRVLSVQVL